MTLADIRLAAQDMTDEHDLKATGKFSKEWWTRQINVAQRTLAQATGYYVKRAALPVIAGQRRYALPTDFCWGVLRVTWDGTPLRPSDIYDLDDRSPGWEQTASSAPDSYAVVGNAIELAPAPDFTLLAGATLYSGTGGAAQPVGGDALVLVGAGPGVNCTAQVFGTAYGQDRTCVSESVAVSGTTPVTTRRTDWNHVMAVFTGTTAGAVIVKRARDLFEVCRTGTSGEFGWAAVGADARGVKPVFAFASAAAIGRPVALRGFEGVSSDTTPIDDCVAVCSGTDAASFTASIGLVSYCLFGALPNQQFKVTVGGKLEITHGAVPPDLSADSDEPVGLPTAWRFLLAEGAAGLAQTGNLRMESGPRGADKVPYSQIFWQNVQRFEMWLAHIQKDAYGPLEVYAP